MISRSIRHLRFLLFILAILGGFAPQILAIDSPADFSAHIHLATFEFNAYARQETGTVLWLKGPDGDMRVEFRRGKIGAPSAAALSPILDQSGHGWTAILNGVGDETINRWGEGWQFPPAGFGATVATIAAELQAGPPERVVSQRTWRAGGSSREYHTKAVASLVTGDKTLESFRQQQAARGYGRGGSDDLLHWYWSDSAGDIAPSLNLTASKWPGILKMRLEASYAGIVAVPEVFVPLWPLRDLVTFLPTK